MLIIWNRRYSTPSPGTTVRVHIHHSLSLWAIPRSRFFQPFSTAVSSSQPILLGASGTPFFRNVVELILLVRNTCLYVSSRTLFAIAQLYGNSFIRNTLGKTNSGHTPMAAILFCSLFGLLAFLGLADNNQARTFCG